MVADTVHIRVDSEFAPLRTVVVSQSEFRAPDSAAVSGHSMPDGLPAPLRDWDRIEVTEEEAAAMATNGLPIDPETYITDPEFDRVGKELEARGITVEYIDFAVSRLFGGAFRCSTQPLLRV